MPAGFEDLPREILDVIVAFLPTARAVSNLARINKALHRYVEDEGWAIFARAKFPWINHHQAQPWSVVARSLTTTSRAWDRRAFVVHDAWPRGDVILNPREIVLTEWANPTGQTVGYSPSIDAYEYVENSSSNVDILAYTAGPNICVRRRTSKVKAGTKTGEIITWSAFKGPGERPGRDDYTSVHLLRPHQLEDLGEHELIHGSVNGGLVMRALSHGRHSPSQHPTWLAAFNTGNESVQATSLFQETYDPPHLAAVLGNSRLALYEVERNQQYNDPVATHDFKTAEATHPAFAASSSRLWTVTHLSRQQLAVGVGQSPAPVQICNVGSAGIDCVRGFGFEDENGNTLALPSVFKILPVPGETHTFLSASYDGLVRLHDLRSRRDAETYYAPANGDIPINSLLMRGHQTLMAGTARHEMICIFDLRHRKGQYYYTGSQTPADSYSLFVTPAARGRRTGGSVYSLASPSLSSPVVYMGIEDLVLELSATELGHKHPNPMQFSPWNKRRPKKQPEEWYSWRVKLQDVAMYANEKLYKQKPLAQLSPPVSGSRIDSRWTITR